VDCSTSPNQEKYKKVSNTMEQEPQSNTEALAAEIDRVTQETAELLECAPDQLTDGQRAKIQERAQVRLHIKQQRSEERKAAEQLKVERDAAQAALKAAHGAKVRDGASNRAPVSADRARALVDDFTFNHRMDEGAKLALLNENPADLPVLKADSIRYFGRASNGKEALELAKSRPAYYARLKEISKILKTYAA
jgi:hypothetical protein